MLKHVQSLVRVTQMAEGGTDSIPGSWEVIFTRHLGTWVFLAVSHPYCLVTDQRH